MSGPSDILTLTGLTGVPLLSRAAVLVGVPDPAALIEANKKADTEQLDARAKEWADLAETIVKNKASLENDAVLVRSGWEGTAAEGFYRYTQKLVGVLEAQESVAKDVSAALSEISSALEDCRRDTDEAIASAIWMTTTEVLVCSLTLIGATVTTPAVLAGIVAAAVVALITILLNLIGFLIVISGKKRKLQLALAQKLKKLVEVSSEKGAEDIAMPESPAIVTKGFSTFTFYPDDFHAKK